MHRLINLPLVFAATALVVSCGPRPQAITSTPQAKGLRVNEFTWGDGILLKKYSFPKAVYQPEKEDKDAFYYYPQNAQVRVFDSGLRYGATAGIRWEKKKVQPDQIFVKAGPGMAVFGKKDIPVTPIN
ncbi:hypothetical protein KBB96_14400 [Luteolibacter ambystomatis]|uniref:Uncharacterized protein n=1 Tax=Luteolibacter ambystomatis TaxID=2824561 RepID=A0A975IYE3_9BACT|nr:hypothetical protein [Luteolibacter ambystomatis]QUE50054.1 hypothetical protein KBB96_14400 [Luteolibacter ambystomatis]